MGFAIAVVLYLLFVGVVASAYYYYKQRSSTTTTTTTKTATTTTAATTTTTAASSATTIAPSTTNRAWVKINYNYAGLNGTSANTKSSDAANQQYVLDSGYNCYVYDGGATIYPRVQGTNGTGNTLVVYKNGVYWTKSNTDIEFGTNAKITFTQASLGNVLNSIKTGTNNLALIRGTVSPTAASSTLVDGTYSIDAAMLDVSSDTSFYTWFYGGTTFPYSYTLSSFTPSS